MRITCTQALLCWTRMEHAHLPQQRHSLTALASPEHSCCRCQSDGAASFTAKVKHALSDYKRKPLWVESGVLTDMQPKNAVSSSMHSSFAALLANFGLTLSGCSLAFPIPQVQWGCSPEWAIGSPRLIQHKQLPSTNHRAKNLIL